MSRAEQIINQYMKQIYGFCLKHTSNLDDAGDLTQEICMRLYEMLSVRDDILNIEHYIWRMAHNLLVDFYRKRQRQNANMSIEDVQERIISNEEAVVERLKSYYNYFIDILEGI